MCKLTEYLDHGIPAGSVGPGACLGVRVHATALLVTLQRLSASLTVPGTKNIGKVFNIKIAIFHFISFFCFTDFSPLLDTKTMMGQEMCTPINFYILFLPSLNEQFFKK